MTVEAPAGRKRRAPAEGEEKSADRSASAVQRRQPEGNASAKKPRQTGKVAAPTVSEPEPTTAPAAAAAAAAAAVEVPAPVLPSLQTSVPALVALAGVDGDLSSSIGKLLASLVDFWRRLLLLLSARLREASLWRRRRQALADAAKETVHALAVAAYGERLSPAMVTKLKEVTSLSQELVGLKEAALRRSLLTTALYALFQST